MQHIEDVISNQAKLDLTAVYIDAAGRISSDMVTLSGNIGGLTLSSEFYRSASSLTVYSRGVTFDANDVFIVRIATTLPQRPGAK